MKKWSILIIALSIFSVLIAANPEQEKNKKINKLLKKSITAIQEKNYEQALVFIQKVKDLDKENAEIYRMEGQLLEMLKKNKEAISAWESCLKFSKSDSLRKEAEIHIQHLRD